MAIYAIIILAKTTHSVPQGTQWGFIFKQVLWINQRGRRFSLRRAQIDLFNHLRNQHITVHKGYLMQNDGVYHEKGVDVKIATDLLVGCWLRS